MGNGFRVGATGVRVATVALVMVVAITVPSPARAATINAVPVRTGLAMPTAFAFAPGGRMFYGERASGSIHILTPSRSTDRLFFTIPNMVSSVAGEKGLLGLAIAPDYTSHPRVYAFVTRVVDGVDVDQIVRIANVNGTGSGMEVLWSMPATFGHNGGHIAFGPDGLLYAVIGEGQVPSRAQDPAIPNGKIIRLLPDGGVPSDNPFPGSVVYATGIRNSFGFGFDPRSGRLWESDNGPECNDELNLVTAGANYGWGPNETCATPPDAPANTNQDGLDPTLPVAWFPTTIAPTGVTFCRTCGLGSDTNGALLFGDYNNGVIRRVRLDQSRTTVVSQASIYDHPSGILSVERAPGGAIYFSDATGIYRLALT